MRRMMRKRSTTQLDRQLIAEVVEREMRHLYGTWAEMERAGLRLGTRRPLSRGTLYRVAMAEEGVSPSTFARCEAILRLPPGTLEAIGRHDLDELMTISVPNGLMVWVRHRMSLDVAVPPDSSAEDAG